MRKPLKEHLDDLEANGEWRDVLNRMNEIMMKSFVTPRKAKGKLRPKSFEKKSVKEMSVIFQCECGSPVIIGKS